MKEVNCIYKGETYSARGTGEVFRHARLGKKIRINDRLWTFGNLNEKTGYMEISGEGIHRIIATAFHGLPPTKEHAIVDHIDTNRQNNRPENLRWVTRLENILLNPITVRRIEIVCECSIEEFLADPSRFRDKFQEPNYKWMHSVTAQQAKTSLENLLAWAKSDKYPFGGSLGEWVFERSSYQKRPEPAVIMAKTLNAAQRDWRVVSEFPCCPQEYSEEPIVAYAEKLEINSVFCRNDFATYKVSKSQMTDNHQTLYVISHDDDGIKPWTLAKITYENNLFMHTGLGTFFEQNGAEKQFCLALGLEWTGGDSIDDYL